MPDSESTRTFARPSSVWWWTALFIIAGIFLSTWAWNTWYARWPASPRNHFFHFAWKDYIRNTPARGTNETLVVVISHSQGYGWEVEPTETYSSLLEQIRRDAGQTFRVVNWSMPGARFNDVIIAAAAARLLDPSYLLISLSPRSVSVTPPAKKSASRSISQMYYLLNDRKIREAIPPDIRSNMTDFPMSIGLSIGTLWPAWRSRSLPAALIAEFQPLEPFYANRGGGIWFRFPKSRENNPRRRIEPQGPAAIDPARASALLDVAMQSAPVCYWINMPMRSTFRDSDPSAWDTLTALCAARGIYSLNMIDAVPDNEYLTHTHLHRDGHRTFAEKLHEVLP